MPSQSGELSELIAYLSEKPSFDQVAQFLVLHSLREFEPRGALICTFHPDGKVDTIGSFGTSAEMLNALRRLTLWDSAPATDAIRDGSPHILNGNAESHAAYQDFEEDLQGLPPLIAWPLQVGYKRLGSLQMQFSKHFDEDAIFDPLSEVADILGFYLMMQGSADGTRDGSRTFGSDKVSNLSVETPRELTERQLRILQLMGDGLTNPQIAARVGYSESTVRQETMAIYRFLGAHGRREASRIASLRGLLPSNEAMATSV